MESHITDEQFEALLACSSANREDWSFREAEDLPGLAHLRSCDECQQRFRAEQVMRETLACLLAKEPTPTESDCPDDDAWMKIALGIFDENTNLLVHHAAQCDHCGPLFRFALSDSATGLSSDEEALIQKLTTARQRGRRRIARLLSGARTTRESSSARSRIPWPNMLRLSRSGALISGAVVLLLAAWFIFDFERRKAPKFLLAEAYAERRTIEVRIEGAPYVPLDQQRGDDLSSLHHLPRLSNAISEIARHLQETPDDVNWLQASGRASMLEGNFQAAIDSLEKARRLEHGSNSSINVDLASAHFLRGQNGHPEDYGVSIELLRSVLHSRPNDEIAEFNYAIVSDYLGTKNDSILAWRRFIADHSQSAWASEARWHLSELGEQSSLREGRTGRPLLTASQAALGLRDPKIADEIDARIEEYQDRALRDWLPQLFAPHIDSENDRRSVHDAIQVTSNLLAQRHHDIWLQEISRSDYNRATIRRALQLLSQSEKLFDTSSDNDTQEITRRAALLFKEGGIEAGRAKAQLTLVMLDQLRHRNHSCVLGATALRALASAHSWRWIRDQSELEIGICSSLDDAEGLRSVSEGLKLSRDDKFQCLALRAENAESGLSWAAGDLHQAWQASIEGLQGFWQSNCPKLRGYNLLANLDDIVQEQQQWYLAESVLEESIPMIADAPDKAMLAFEEGRLGEALLQIGENQKSESAFRQMRKEYIGLPLGERRSVLMSESELGQAKAEIQRGDLSTGIRRLEGIRQTMEAISEDDLKLDYFETIGSAWARQGNTTQAEAYLVRAVGFAEEGLFLAEDNQARVRWSRRNGSLYRTLVRLKLSSDPEEAWLLWEWYKSAALRVPKHLDMQTLRGELSSSRIRVKTQGIATDAVFISYVQFPEDIAVWVWNGASVHQKWLNISTAALDSSVSHFLQDCSDPNSRIDLVRSEGAELFRQLLLPIEPWIGGRTQIIVEPDGILRSIPFEVLVDPYGRFLSEHSSIVISPGLGYLFASRKWAGLTSSSSALIIGNPTAEGWRSLPDAELEARTVAAMFNRPRLIVDASSIPENLPLEIAESDVFQFSGHSAGGAQTVGLQLGRTGILSASRLGFLIKARTQLVVLSSCVSARGTSGQFDDSDSLVERFAESGVPEVVASRWEIDSAATRRLMKRFYEETMRGAVPSAALRTAIDDLRSEPSFSHPFYWGAFTVFGKG